MIKRFSSRRKKSGTSCINKRLSDAICYDHIAAEKLEIRLLLGTDAASEGLNIQKLGLLFKSFRCQ
jgi:hypothetical protein